MAGITHEPTWGGLCIDEKGVYWETLVAMAARHGRSGDLIHLRIGDNGNTDAITHRFNLTGNRAIPFTTYAKFVVDTAASLGQGGDKGCFKSQAQTHIAHALELLHELDRPATLQGAYELLTVPADGTGTTRKPRNTKSSRTSFGICATTSAS